MQTKLVLRDAQPTDFGDILALNAESVRFLSPLTQSRLALLVEQSALCRVVEEQGAVVAFLLAFREGSAYDSPNYRWFVDRYDRFLYVDRVVVSSRVRAAGTGSALYRDVFEVATRAEVPLVTAEIDLDPPNPVSFRFHDKFGFYEVGQQRVAEGTKLVSLQAARVPRHARPAGFASRSEPRDRDE